MRQQSLVLASSKMLFSLQSSSVDVICQHFNRTLYIANLEQTNAPEPGFELAQFCALVLTHSEHDELRSYWWALSFTQDSSFFKTDGIKVRGNWLAVRSLRSYYFPNCKNSIDSLMLGTKRKNSRQQLMIFSKQIYVSSTSWQNGLVYWGLKKETSCRGSGLLPAFCFLYFKRWIKVNVPKISFKLGLFVLWNGRCRDHIFIVENKKND